MSGGEIAGLIAAFAFVLLVGVVAIPMVKLGGVFDETRNMIKGVSDETVPLLSEVTTTVTTTNAQSATTNVSALTSLLAATLGSPVVKVAAFTYGVRTAMSGRGPVATERRVRAQVRAEEAAGRARSRRRGRPA